MNCSKCIHFKRCLHLGTLLRDGMIEDAESFCGDFEVKNDDVAVRRDSCRECVHYKACKKTFKKALKITSANPNNYTVLMTCELYKPAVDVVEVVRCKDCIRFHYIEDANTAYCTRLLKYMKTDPNGYCSYGERR